MYSAFGCAEGSVGARVGGGASAVPVWKGEGSGRQTRPPMTFGDAEGPFLSSCQRITRLKAPEERGSESRA